MSDTVEIPREIWTNFLDHFERLSKDHLAVSQALLARLHEAAGVTDEQEETA